MQGRIVAAAGSAANRTIVAVQDVPSTQSAAWQEPLTRLARFALDNAGHLCDPQAGCRDYHRAWTMLRLYEMDGALPTGFDFLQRELLARAGELGTGRLRLMISGAADTGQAALVLKALLPAGIRPDLVVVDICRTPVEQHRLFLHEQGVKAELLHGDAVEIDTAPVDAILAHSFFAFVRPDRRAALVRNWARLLVPGGRVLVTERFAHTPGYLPAWPDPGERDARRARLRAKLAAQGLPPEEVEVMAEAADRLWDMTGKRHRMSEDQFREMLAAAELRLVRFDLSDAKANFSPVQSIAAAEQRPRAQAVAVKP